MKLKYEFEQKEVDFILQALNETSVKGFQANQFMLALANKLQNPLNKKEFDAEQLAQISKQIKGEDQPTTQVVTPDMIKKMNDLKKPK